MIDGETVWWWREHKVKTVCYLCGYKFNEMWKFFLKVRDHCPYTGKYRGTAHSKCYLNYRGKKTLLVLVINASGYDNHLIIAKVGEKFKMWLFT